MRLETKMHRIRSRLAFGSVVAAMACGGTSDTGTQLPADLQKDLAAVASSKLELASGSQDYQRMRFVSAIEQVPTGSPVERKQAPRRVARNPASHEGAETRSPDVQAADEVLVAETPAAQPEPTPAEEDVSAVPSVSPRPSPLPVDAPSVGNGDYSRVGHGDQGADIGGIIGVVIRGGRVDPGHCPPRRRGGRPVVLPRVGRILVEGVFR
jgi:hypothetical protein